jgi:hypothetical protein
LRSAQKNRTAAWESHERLMVVGSQARSMIRDTWGLTAAGSWHTVVATREAEIQGLIEEW